MCWNRVIVWHRCISAFKFKTILVSAFFLLFLLYCILDPSKSEYPVKKRRTLKRVFEERRERMENYCDADKSTPKTPLRELLPPKKPNFHILENLRTLLLSAIVLIGMKYDHEIYYINIAKGTTDPRVEFILPK